MEKTLSQVYTRPQNLYTQKKNTEKSATWLTYTMPYHFKTNRVFAEGIDYECQGDLVDLGSVQKYNNRFRYLLTCKDTFSKYAWATPLKNKTDTTLVSAFKTILSSNWKPTYLQTDDGTEFKNSVFQQFLKNNGIKFLTTKSEKKASIVERFNRTLKTKMWKYFTAKNTVHYLDVLPEVVSYNSTYHRSIKMAPN